ncbi:hypothetical protein B9Z55_000717 [Caenorhabditis nigoni]|uniref:Uncharacterized protein n=1 Tax=Caenorhabditis nigoni TaxID=1611254 RepID=A0A2G5VUG8_9PELO|nr:hypothetical protein B9Z55_000717 [Caenorhabditis nigoni]
MAQAAAVVNHGQVTIRDAEHYDGVYATGEDQPHTLYRSQLDCYATVIGKPPSPDKGVSFRKLFIISSKLAHL